MPRLPSKAVRADTQDALTVSFAANQDGAFQTSMRANFSTGAACVPFAGGTVLTDRKWLVLTFPTDWMWFGPTGMSETTGYMSRGVGRAGDYTDPPNVEEYSNRKQFLCGQYTRLALLDSVVLCAREGFAAVEKAGSLEFA